MRKFIAPALALGAALMSTPGGWAAPENGFPPDERWTENTSAKGEFGWGNYEGTQTSITADDSEKKRGNSSIKYSGAHNKAGGVLGPALIFPVGKYLDITPFAGGKLGLDVHLADATNFQYLQLVLMSDGVQAHQVSRNLNLQAGWNRIEVPLAAAGGWKEAGWSGSRAADFNPKALHQIRFRFVYRKDNAYDSATPRDIRFDGLQLTRPATASATTPQAVAPKNDAGKPVTASATTASATTANAATKVLAPGVLQERERRVVAVNQRIEPEQTWRVELPKLAGDGARLLRVTVRRNAPQLGGYGAYLHLALNGQPLDAAKSRNALRLVNKPAAFTRPNGQQVFWNRGDGIWQTIFAPDFETSFKRYGPDVAEPYTYLLDVTDLVREGAPNIVELSSYFPVNSGENDMSLYASLEWIAAERPSAGAVVAARPKLAAQPKLTLAPDGALVLSTDGQPLRIESSFSVPGGGRNHFGAASRETAWQPKITALGTNRWRVEASGATYRLLREIEQSDGRIAVRDTFENLTDGDVGIIFSNDVNLAAHPALDYVRIGGQRGQGINEVLSRENPTLFFPLQNSSLTLVAEDDVYRNQAIFYYDTQAQRSGVRDPMFALAPRAKYTAQWSVYTLPSEEYFDMINRVRRDWNSNITLRGPIYFANFRQIAAMPEADLKTLVAKHDARYICFWEISTPAPQSEWDNRTVFAEGPGVFNPIFKSEVELVKQAVNKLHAISPDIKVSLYSHSFFISPERPDDRTFEDSWVTTAAGERSTSVYNNATRYPFRTVFPTLQNSYGQAYMKVLDFYFDELKLDWLYWDESNGPGVTVDQGDSLEGYLTYNAWDGHSAKIDAQTGNITQKCGFITLLSDDFIAAAVQKAEQRGGFVLFNGAATTKQRRRSPSFVETQWDITSNYRTHLNTPLAYGLGKPSMTDLRRRLEFGTIYARTHLDYEGEAVVRNYPFTPLELHRDWVKGRERIITAKSGAFGWDDAPFSASLHLYDAAGKLARTQEYSAPQTAPVPVEVPENGLAILERVR